MSTILDALRKLEEEQQSRTANARSRLLLPSVYRVRASRAQQSPWRPGVWPFGIGVFVLAGFAAGAGMMWWRAHEERPRAERSSTPSSTQSTEPKRAATVGASPTRPAASDTVDTTKEGEPSRQPSQKQSQPATEITPAPLTTALTRETAPAVVEEPAPQASAPGQANADAAFSVTEAAAAKAQTRSETSVVQRSPFIALPPTPREAPPIPKDVATTAKRSTLPAPPASKATDGATYEVLMPSGATRVVKPPSSTSTKVETPTTPAPSGTSLSLLQWSSDPERRIAFIRVNGGALTMAHEGDTVGGYKVVEIRQNAVELQAGESHVTLHTR